MQVSINCSHFASHIVLNIDISYKQITFVMLQDTKTFRNVMFILAKILRFDLNVLLVR